MATATPVDPWSLGLSAAGAGLGAVVTAISAADAKKRADQLAAQQQQLTKDQANQQVALKETTLDPFRQQMSQAGDISALDRLQLGSYTPVHLTAAPGYEKYVPQMTGGFSYQKSPELISSAAALKQNIMGGNVAPTMTDPTNYGKTAALNLVSMAANGVDPSTINASGGPPRSVSAYTTGLPNRVVGGIGTAATRATDYSVADATNAVTKAIQDEFGRQPQPGEIDKMLAGQGLKPGDHWVGSGGLNYILTTIRAQAAQGPAAPSYTGH